MAFRPDELASMKEIESDQKLRQGVKSGIKTAATLATGVGVAGLGSRLAPFLSEFIPTDLAIKGISKISPKVGDFLKKGQSMGLNVKEGIEYVKKQISPSSNKNIIEQYSPELHQFIEQNIKNGRSVEEAGALAQIDKKFESAIKKLSTDHKAPWSQILQSAYGSDQKEPVQDTQTATPATSPQQAAVQPQQQAGQGQAALMAILDKINKKLGQ